MRTISAAFLVFVSTILTSLGGCHSPTRAQRQTEIAPVVFVCEHGNVKSLIGASLFNQVAEERGLPFRALSRGVTPEAGVPTKIAEALRGEGVEVASFKPQPLSSLDVSQASRVIAIGVDLSSFSSAARVPIEVWNDVPPASVDFAASRAALLSHIDVMLDELQAER